MHDSQLQHTCYCLSEKRHYLLECVDPASYNVSAWKAIEVARECRLNPQMVQQEAEYFHLTQTDFTLLYEQNDDLTP